MNPKIFTSLILIFIFDGFWGFFDLSAWYMYVCIFICFLCALVSINNKNISFFWGNKILWLFLLSIGLNFYFSYLNRHLPPIQVLRTPAVLDFFFFFSFFIFVSIRLSTKDIENILKISFFIFLTCFFLEYFVFFPLPVFKFTSATENEHRFRLVGQLVGFIGYFYYMNRLLMNRGKTFSNICYVFGGLLFVILLGFRTHLISIVIASMYLIFRIKGFSLKKIRYYLIIVSFGAAVIFSTSFGKEVINHIIERNETDVMTNDDYVRARQWVYFTNYHFISTTDYLFGSGFPTGNNAYSQNMSVFYKNEKENLSSPTQWRDWGLLGLSWVMGLPLFLVLISFIAFMIFKKVPEDYLFISATYLELLLSGFSTIEFYREGAFVFHGLILCLMLQIVKSDKVAKLDKVILSNKMHL